MYAKNLQHCQDETTPRSSNSHTISPSKGSAKSISLQNEMDALESQFKNALVLKEPPKEQQKSDRNPKIIIENVLRIRSFDQVVQEKFKLDITRGDIDTLVGTKWLNDQIINFYMNLITERSAQTNRLRVYTTNTFFYNKLISNGYESVRRWTKKVDLFEYELILVPINLTIHWTIAVIDFRNKSIKYYDSLGGSNHQCVSALLNYLEKEKLDKKNVEFESNGWKTYPKVSNLPKQTNSYDCGVFICTYAEFISRDASFTMSQDKMGRYRMKMIYEIVTGKLVK